MSKTVRAGMSALALDPLKNGRLMRSIVTALVMGLVLGWGVPASAQQTKCLAGKTKCMATKAAGLLKCAELAETPGKVADPNCVPKVEGKFQGIPDPTKGCFGKLESKASNNCNPGDDTDPAETAVDDCVSSLVDTIDPPPTTPSKCDVGKKKCVAKYLVSVLKCHATALTPGKDTSPNAGFCVDKATAKYTGGADMTKGCFAKLEAKVPNDCQIPGDSDTIKGIADTCVTDLVAVVTNTTSTTTTTTTSTTTTTCPAPAPPLVRGSLTKTFGRFTYSSPLNTSMKIGLPSADLACASDFVCTHACTLAELQSAPKAELMGLKDTANMTVTSFWGIDPSAPDLAQCVDDTPGGSGLRWEYGTAHTASRATTVALDATGTLGTPQTGLTVTCAFGSENWVACCR